MTDEKEAERKTVMGRIVAFAASIWPGSGARSAQEKVQRTTERKAAVQKKRIHYRARARAYVNPWHNI